MKRSVLLMLVIAFISIQSYSQENKGKFMLGGRASLGFYDSENENSESYSNTNSQSSSIEVPVGYFVSNRFLVGLDQGYRYRKYSSESNYNDSPAERENSSYSYFVGPYVRYYTPIINKLDFFMELNATYGFGEEKTNYVKNGELQYETEGKQTGLNANFLPGLSYQISDWLFLDCTFGRLTYNQYHYKPNEESEYDREKNDSDFIFSFNSFSFGLTARLGK